MSDMKFEEDVTITPKNSTKIKSISEFLIRNSYGLIKDNNDVIVFELLISCLFVFLTLVFLSSIGSEDVPLPPIESI